MGDRKLLLMYSIRLLEPYTSQLEAGGCLLGCCGVGRGDPAALIHSSSHHYRQGSGVQKDVNIARMWRCSYSIAWLFQLQLGLMYISRRRLVFCDASWCSGDRYIIAYCVQKSSAAFQRSVVGIRRHA